MSGQKRRPVFHWPPLPFNAPPIACIVLRIILELRVITWRGTNEMSAISTISATVFAAYLRCSTKAHLLARGEKPPGSFFTDTLGRISSAYKAIACERLGAGVAGFASISRLPLPTAPASDRAVAFVDCETASYALDTPTRAPSDRKTRRDEFGPD